jgi:hypothetical protein
MPRTRKIELFIRDSLPSFQQRFNTSPALSPPGAKTIDASLPLCPVCNGTGEETQGNVAYQRSFCRPCGGVGFVEMELGPTSYPPGTTMKISVLAARYDEGLPLYHAMDAR